MSPLAAQPRPFPSLLDLLRCEFIKLRRSLILGLALLFPLGLLTISMLVGFLVIEPRGHATWRQWMSYSLFPWASFLLPLMVCLLATLLLNLEHQNHQWKHLNAMPIHRWKHLAAKQVLLVLLLLFSHALLLAGFWLGGWVLKLARPALHLEAPDLLLAASLLGFLSLACLAVVGVHAWLALRFPNLGVNLGVGLAGVMFIPVVGMRPAMARAFPWSSPGRCLGDWMGGPNTASPWLAVSLSLGLGALLLGLACWDAQRRESQG